MTTTDSIYFTARSNHGGHYDSTHFRNEHGLVQSSQCINVDGSWQTIVILEVRLEEGVAPEATARKLLAADTKADHDWYDLLRHDFLEVAELWRQKTGNKLRGVREYKIGEEVTEWHGTKLTGPAKMTRRDDVKPGQTVFSSHGYYFEVGEVHSQGLVTQINPARPGLHGERYDRDLLIPVML